MAHGILALLQILHIPCPPDGIIEADLVSPLELQALEILPFGGYQLPTFETF